MSDIFDQTYADFSAARRAQIMARIEAACARVGRDVSEVSPVAVSKTVGTGELLAAWRAGWRRFAENRPQELTRKLAFVGQTPEMAGAAFDLIGNLQKNKINQVVGKVGLIHSISSSPFRSRSAPSAMAPRAMSCSRSTSRARHPSRASRLTSCAPAWTTSWPVLASACAAS